MNKNLETGTNKIKKICDILKNETLDPAKEEARQIIEQAHQEAHEILRAAEKKGEEIIQNGKNQLEKEKSVFQTSFIQACRQGIEALKQEIQENIFNKELEAWIGQTLSGPDIIAEIVKALVNALEKEGLKTDFSLILPQVASQEQVIHALTERVQAKLKDKPMEVGGFIGGVKLRLIDQSLTIDMSDQAVKELLERYIGKTFRKYLFENG